MSRFGSARRAAWGWLRSAGQQRYLGRDLLAGLPVAVGSVPDGMAAAILAGVNPVQGLYAGFAGPITGGLTANTRLMVITTTSASALAAGSALSGVPAAQRPAEVPVLAIIAGVALVAAGVAKLGRYTRFVSYSVMTGFLTGVAVNIVCGQIPDLTGAPAKGAFPLAKAINVLVHPSSINLASLLTGLGALAILVVWAGRRGGWSALWSRWSSRPWSSCSPARPAWPGSETRVISRPASRCRACPTSGWSRSAWSPVRSRWRRSCSCKVPG
jgi:MFS superfamily sulfate permease-like transporter